MTSVLLKASVFLYHHKSETKKNANSKFSAKVASIRVNLGAKKRNAFTPIGPLQLGSHDQIFPRNFDIMDYSFKRCRKWKERIENITMTKLSLYDSLNFRKI